jgi:hypothetical protein
MMDNEVDFIRSNNVTDVIPALNINIASVIPAKAGIL